MTFELCAAALARDSSTIECPLAGSDRMLQLQMPPLLTGADLSRVKARTTRRWYVLSGLHRQSRVVLTIRRESLARWLQVAERAVRRGDRLALVIEGQVHGVMTLQQIPSDPEFDIPAGFFSSGTESQQVDDAKTLARSIQAAIP